MNREHERLLEWFRTVRFKRTLIGGINEVQLWKKLAELNEIYEAALRAERARFDALIEAFARSAGMSVTKYKGELAQADAKYSELSRRFAEYLVRAERVTATANDKPQTCAQIIRARRANAETAADAVSLAARTAVLLLFAYLFFSRVFLLAQAPGNDMFPAVKDGDLLIGYRLQRDFSKNDVVVYTAEGERRTGRVLGRASDVITIDGSGTLLVNGTAQAGEIMYPTYPEEGLGYPYTVPDGCVFILGDYRTQSQDSRDFGAIALDDVEAKVITVIRRRSL